MKSINIIFLISLLVTSQTFAQPVELDVQGSIQLLNDADILGLDQIIGCNDIRLYGDNNGGPDLFLHANGNLGIGTDSPSVDVNIKQRNNPNPWGVYGDFSGLMIEYANTEAVVIGLARFGHIFFAFGSGNSFSTKSAIQYWNGDYNSVSDRRLKYNIDFLPPVLNEVLKIKPSIYYLKDDIHKRTDIGLIAQDVEMYFPEVVSTINGLKSISYGKLSVLVVKAIQEQQLKIDYVKELLETLERELYKAKEARTSN